MRTFTSRCKNIWFGLPWWTALAVTLLVYGCEAAWAISVPEQAACLEVLALAMLDAGGLSGIVAKAGGVLLMQLTTPGMAALLVGWGTIAAMTVSARRRRAA